MTRLPLQTNQEITSCLKIEAIQCAHLDKNHQLGITILTDQTSKLGMRETYLLEEIHSTNLKKTNLTHWCRNTIALRLEGHQGL